MARELLEIGFSIASTPEAPNPAFEPGARHLHANLNTVIPGDVACRLTGRTLERLLEERILVPPAMGSSYVPLSGACLAPHSRGHSRILSADGSLEDTTTVSASWADAAGVVVSTHQDMARWLPVLLRGDGLPEALEAERLIGHAVPRGRCRIAHGSMSRRSQCLVRTTGGSARRANLNRSERSPARAARENRRAALDYDPRYAVFSEGHRPAPGSTLLR